uniref:MULE transposase domain-containing protein n=1 Tax=Phytophthora infestans TaxID=4787 RepID=Q572L9_PHYIN|nr:hypothetical protein PI35.0030 [Phytophthora infestans]
MPRRVPWEERAVGIDAAAADAVMETMKAFEIQKSQTMACSMCIDAEHKMRYRLLTCSSGLCCEASELDCEWRGKIVTCLETAHVSIFEYGAHNTRVSSPNSKKLTTTQKIYCRELADEHLRPMRIRHALARKFSTPLEDLPPLKTVQNFVNNYSRTYLENHDRVQELRAWVHARAYTGLETMTQTFTFGWKLDSSGKPIVGNGSDEKPFIVGLSTKALMLRLTVPPQNFILHVDGTYKMNQCDYPVIVVGISDRSRRFHLVALFVVSQETQSVFEAVFFSLRRIYFWITKNDLRIQYAMADGDKAQCNALALVFGGNPSYRFLMCFFHVMKKVQERIRSFSSGVAATVLREVYDLHFARSEAAYLEMLRVIMTRWLKEPALVQFAQYMHGQWLIGLFTTWQIFATPSGFATTNNPAETFSALIKRYAFEFGVVPTPTLARRVSELVRAQLLGIAEGQEVDAVSGGVAGEPNIIRVISLPAPRVTVAPNKRTEEGIAVSAQMGVNYARKEVEGQPFGGWHVDSERQWCQCDYCYAFGTCIHVLYALRATTHVDSSGRDILVNRKKRRRYGVAVLPVVGRPRTIGPALSFE